MRVTMMRLSRRMFCLCVAAGLAAPAAAQFTGPSIEGQTATVAAAQEARIGAYMTLTGRVLAHLREDYYRFADDTGEMRVEIEPGAWRGQRVGPETTVRLMGEVDRSLAGTRYLWVKSLTVVD
jgi:uncharacterized protein (TIGR00156 family)